MKRAVRVPRISARPAAAGWRAERTPLWIANRCIVTVLSAGTNRGNWTSASEIVFAAPQSYACVGQSDIHRTEQARQLHIV